MGATVRLTARYLSQPTIIATGQQESLEDKSKSPATNFLKHTHTGIRESHRSIQPLPAHWV